MGLRFTAATLIGSALLIGGLFGQGSVPTSHLLTPMDFGAVGNGLADDTVAMQKAIDATINGGSLYFPGGHKYLVRALHAEGEVHWLGPGGSWLNDRAADGAVIIQGNDATEDLLTLHNSAYSNISGIAFDGNKLHQSKKLNGMRLINCEFTRFDNIYVTSCSGHGILLENINTVQTSDEIDLVDCYSVLNGLDGVHYDFQLPGGVFAPGDCEIIGGHYDFNTGNGISLHVSHYTSITGANVLSNGGAGISAIFCTGLNITSNMVRNNRLQGIVLGAGPTFTNCTNCNLSGNQVHLNSRAGVGKYAGIDIGFGSTNTRLIGNYCGDVNPSPDYPVSTKVGVWLHDGAKGTILVANTCPPSENVVGGFAMDAGCTYTSVANSGLRDYSLDGTANSQQHFIASGGSIGRIAVSKSNEIWVGVDGSAGGVLLLPTISNAFDGQTIVVKDEGTGPSYKPLLITSSDSTIDGKPSVKLPFRSGTVKVRLDRGKWWTW